MPKPKRKVAEMDELDQLLEEHAGAGVGPAPNEYKDRPDWRDEEAQLEYIRNQITGWPILFPYRSEEERAVEAALCGDPEQLIELRLNPDLQLQPSTRKLADEFARRERNWGNGRAKGKPGRPRGIEEQRRKNNPTHRAAERFLVIRDLLALVYTEQSDRDIYDRAMQLAIKLTGLKIKNETLQNHRDKVREQRPPYRVYGHQEEDSQMGKWIILDQL